MRTMTRAKSPAFGKEMQPKWGTYNKPFRILHPLGDQELMIYPHCLQASHLRRMIKTGFPRHLTVTVVPGSMLERSTSREASARTSLLADMLRTNFKTRSRIREAYTKYANACLLGSPDG